MRDALKSLKEDESTMVLPADKGRASVVMDTDTYRAKMSTLIENGPYQLLNKDPTDRLTRKLSEKLLTLKRSGYLPEAVYNKIRPRHKQPPRIYGLPKIHKADVPLRLIVSCVNTFAYDLSAYLANIPVSNGYPFSFLQKRTKSGKPNNSAEPAHEFKATAVLPYVKGLSEQLRCCLQQQGLRAVFKSETTLRSQLVRPKDAVEPAKQDGA